VSQDLQGLGIPGGNQTNPGISIESGAHINDLSVFLNGHAVACEILGNAVGNFETVGRIFKRLYVAIGKCYMYHFILPLSLLLKIILVSLIPIRTA
jgi:hypothetical protein